LFLLFSRLSDAVRDEADGRAAPRSQPPIWSYTCEDEGSGKSARWKGIQNGLTPLLEQPTQYASNRAIIIDRSQRQIDATDKLIDQLVYELYGLTDEEIRIVEEGTK